MCIGYLAITVYVSLYVYKPGQIQRERERVCYYVFVFCRLLVSCEASRSQPPHVPNHPGYPTSGPC